MDVLQICSEVKWEDDGQKSDFIFMFNDSDSRRKRIALVVYLKGIEEQLSTLWESDLIFMEDNASIHAAHIIKNWLADTGTDVMDWLFYSSGST